MFPLFIPYISVFYQCSISSRRDKMSYFSSLDLSTLPPPPPLAFLTCAVKIGWGVDELDEE